MFSTDDTIFAGCKNFVLQLILPALEKIGWEALPDEDILTGELRALLVKHAGLNGHEP